MSKTLMIAGCGDVGSRLARRLAATGWRVYGLRRDVAQLPAEIHPVAGDLQQPACPEAWPRGELDYLVYCAAASQHDEAGYRAAYVDGLRHVLAWLAEHGQRPRRLLFVSSSGVYVQQSGEWIDEDSPAEAEGYSGRVMLEAERLAPTVACLRPWCASPVSTALAASGCSTVCARATGGQRTAAVRQPHSRR